MAADVKQLQSFIDGELVDHRGESEPILNPATGEVIAQAPVCGPTEVNEAVQAARRPSRAWSPQHPREPLAGPARARGPRRGERRGDSPLRGDERGQADRGGSQ